MFYLVNLFVIIIYYYLLVGKDIYNEEKRKRFASIVCIHVVLFRALANPYNYVDTIVYSNAFDVLRTWSFYDIVYEANRYTDWGIGFITINWIVGQFTSDAQWMFSFIAALSLVPVVWYHYKVSHNMLVSLVLYLTYPMMFFMSFGVIRQHLAAGIMLLALYFVNNYKVSIPLAIVSALCHTSAVIFFPFYLFRFVTIKNLSAKRILFAITASLVCAFLLMGILISAFARHENVGETLEDRSNALPLILMGSLLLLMFLLRVHKMFDDDHERDAFLFLSYGIALSIMGIGLQGMGRLTIYNMYIVPICMSITYKYAQNNRIIVSLYNLALLLLIVFLLIQSRYSYEYIPFWDNNIIEL